MDATGAFDIGIRNTGRKPKIGLEETEDGRNGEKGSGALFSKRLLNGPCGGSTETRCEVDDGRPCAWQLIFNRLKGIHQLDHLARGARKAG